MNFVNFFLSDFLSRKCANTPTQKHPRGKNVLIPPSSILLKTYFPPKNTNFICPCSKTKFYCFQNK